MFLKCGHKYVTVVILGVFISKSSTSVRKEFTDNSWQCATAVMCLIYVCETHLVNVGWLDYFVSKSDDELSVFVLFYVYGYLRLNRFFLGFLLFLYKSNTEA